MKTSRIFRIFMMALDTILLALLRLVRPFTRLFTNEEVKGGDSPAPHPSARPENLGIQAQLTLDGQPVESYARTQPISFDPAQPYSTMEGVVTFRGDCHRRGGSYGTCSPASLEKK